MSRKPDPIIRPYTINPHHGPMGVGAHGPSKKELELEEMAAQMSSNATRGIEEMMVDVLPDKLDAACSLWGVAAPAVVSEIFGLVTELHGADEMANSQWFNFADSAALMAKGASQLKEPQLWLSA